MREPDLGVPRALPRGQLPFGLFEAADAAVAVPGLDGRVAEVGLGIDGAGEEGRAVRVTDEPFLGEGEGLAIEALLLGPLPGVRVEGGQLDEQAARVGLLLGAQVAARHPFLGAPREHADQRDVGLAGVDHRRHVAQEISREQARLVALAPHARLLEAQAHPEREHRQHHHGNHGAVGLHRALDQLEQRIGARRDRAAGQPVLEVLRQRHGRRVAGAPLGRERLLADGGEVCRRIGLEGEHR